MRDSIPKSKEVKEGFEQINESSCNFYRVHKARYIKFLKKKVIKILVFKPATNLDSPTLIERILDTSNAQLQMNECIYEF